MWMDETNSTETTEVVNKEVEQTSEKDVKIEELAENYKKAMLQERTEKKEVVTKLSEYEAQLAEYKRKDAELQEKEKLKKGKYEEVIEEQKAKLSELEKKALAYDELIAKRNTALEWEVKTLKEQIPEALQNKYSNIIDKLDLDERVSFYKNILEDIKWQDYSTKPWNDWVSAKWDVEMEQAKSKWFDWFMEALMKNNL